jgi:hypothetical protein
MLFRDKLFQVSLAQAVLVVQQLPAVQRVAHHPLQQPSVVLEVAVLPQLPAQTRNGQGLQEGLFPQQQQFVP